MRERAELIGAHSKYDHEPDGGTVVRLTIPTNAVVSEGERMSDNEYGGTDRRRGGPDRRDPDDDDAGS